MQHEPGEILSEPTLCDSWIDPAGRQHYVPSMGHHDVAYLVIHEDPNDLEARGWIHLSLYGPGYVVLHQRYRPTNRQIDLMMDLMELADRMIDYADPRADKMLTAVRMFFAEIQRSGEW
jgi:hypothetical protein